MGDRERERGSEGVRERGHKERERGVGQKNW